ncbi:MAG: RraA family protein [Anaerolineae bacterium]
MPRWINTDFDRVAADLLAQFADIPTTVLCDSMNRFQAMDAGISPLKSGTHLVGSALTAQAMESSNWEAHQALSLAQAGDVLVIAARGGMYGAVWGHVMTHAAQQIGLAGVVIDGCIRDKAENLDETLPIYCRGTAPGGPHKGWQGNLNVPVACGGVVVNAGDIIVGDDDGVVVVPRQHAQAVLAEARQRLDTEAEWYRRIDAGERTADILGLPKP